MTCPVHNASDTFLARLLEQVEDGNRLKTFALDVGKRVADLTPEPDESHNWLLIARNKGDEYIRHALNASSKAAGIAEKEAAKARVLEEESTDEAIRAAQDWEQAVREGPDRMDSKAAEREMYDAEDRAGIVQIEALQAAHRAHAAKAVTEAVTCAIEAQATDMKAMWASRAATAAVAAAIRSEDETRWQLSHARGLFCTCIKMPKSAPPDNPRLRQSLLAG